ncbi:hypothetical protein NL676_033589 [Syzygium grande]|nr:hypothetical protein NL676_033589 [Syzygium grande]
MSHKDTLCTTIFWLHIGRLKDVTEVKDDAEVPHPEDVTYEALLPELTCARLRLLSSAPSSLSNASSLRAPTLPRPALAQATHTRLVSHKPPGCPLCLSLTRACHLSSAQPSWAFAGHAFCNKPGSKGNTTAVTGHTPRPAAQPSGSHPCNLLSPSLLLSPARPALPQPLTGRGRPHRPSRQTPPVRITYARRSASPAAAASRP